MVYMKNKPEYAEREFFLFMMGDEFHTLSQREKSKWMDAGLKFIHSYFGKHQKLVEYWITQLRPSLNMVVKDKFGGHYNFTTPIGYRTFWDQHIVVPRDSSSPIIGAIDTKLPSLSTTTAEEVATTAAVVRLDDSSDAVPTNKDNKEEEKEPPMRTMLKDTVQMDVEEQETSTEAVEKQDANQEEMEMEKEEVTNADSVSEYDEQQSSDSPLAFESPKDLPTGLFIDKTFVRTGNDANANMVEKIMDALDIPENATMLDVTHGEGYVNVCILWLDCVQS